MTEREIDGFNPKEMILNSTFEYGTARVKDLVCRTRLMKNGRTEVRPFEFRLTSAGLGLSLRLWFFRLGLFSGIERVLQGHEVLTRFKRVERGLFSLQLLVRVVGSLDRQADSTVALVNFDDAGCDFLANLEHVLNFIHALLADL